MGLSVSLPDNAGSDLLATIERARALLDDGDYKAARLLATGVYEQAKAAAGYAEKVKASRQLIDKARRMQADALKIETYATIRLADEVDAAQQAGTLVSRGRPKNASREIVLRLSDIGFSRQDVFKARQLRAVERDEPGFIERAVEARISEGLEPNRKSLDGAARGRATEALCNDEIGRPARYRLMDGRPVSRLKWYEIKGVIRRLEKDLQILTRVSSHCVPPTDDQLVSDIIGPELLAQICRGGPGDE